MTGKESWKRLFRRDNLLILILSGVLLFIIALPTKENKGKGDTVQSEQKLSLSQTDSNDGLQEKNGGNGREAADRDFAAGLEQQLEGILTEMADVGKVKVMITLKSSEELVVEKDEPVMRSNTNESDSAGGSRIVVQVDSTESTVYRTTGGNSEPYVVKTLSPQVEGVVVVAQGAGNGTVNQSITEMVQALFGVEAHKVKVVKMASGK